MKKRSWFSRSAVYMAVFASLVSCNKGYHSQADYFSNPDDRTLFRMRTLQANIEKFAAERGRLPTSLDEVLRPSATPGEYSFRHDGWGRTLLYSVAGSSFELRSLGPDGVEGTPDDLTLNGTS